MVDMAPNGMTQMMAGQHDDEYGAVFSAPASLGRDIVARSSMTLVTFGCAAAVALALVGAAYAVDSPLPLGNAALKGDRLAETVSPAATLTVQDVNVDAGISNLVIIPTEPGKS
jgi:hypothetical protein